MAWRLGIHIPCFVLRGAITELHVHLFFWYGKIGTNVLKLCKPKKGAMDQRIVQFYRQYLQQVDHLSFPPPDVLLEPRVQEQISQAMFDESRTSHLPPPRYRKRVLRRLTEQIIAAIKDPDEEVGPSFLRVEPIIVICRPPPPPPRGH